MKNKILFTLAVALSLQVLGQTYTPCTDCDTIPNRCRNYYYFNQPWHDTCQCFLNGDNCYLQFNTPLGVNGENFAKRYTTQEPLTIKGLTALTRLRTGSVEEYYSNERRPEYLYLYQRVCPADTNNHFPDDSCMVLVDSVRWDTVKPHYMAFKPYRDSDIYEYCYAWDAYFENPVHVDSVFYIMGTNNSDNQSDDGSRYIPVKYISYWAPRTLCAPQDWALGREHIGTESPYFWTDFHFPNIFGYNMAIVDNDSVAVVSCEEKRGKVTQVGLIPHGHTATVEAKAAEGYRFAYWSDGSRDSSRSFVATRDMTLTAYFFHESPESCNIEAAPLEADRGTVSGSGTYREGDTVKLTAKPSGTRYEFACWEDGNTDNPRAVIAFKDMLYVAHFYDIVGIQEAKGAEDGVTLSPNPAKRMFTVASTEKIVELTVVNASGVTVYRARPDGQRAEIKVEDWAAGAYMVTVTTEKGRTVKKMIKN